jgi:hypothetical protein
VAGRAESGSAVGDVLDAMGIDPVTRLAKSPDPPHDPPGPIAISIEQWQPIYAEFVERVTRIAGSDSIVLLTEDHPALLPSVCWGVIGVEMWSMQLACVARGLEVRMFEKMQKTTVDDGNGLDRTWPGYQLIGFNDDWRGMVDEAAREMVRSRNEFIQRDVLSMLSAVDVGRPTVWSRHLDGRSGVVYTFERVLGLGGTAIVAEVRDEMGRRFAAKALSAHRLPVENRRERFEREGRLLAEIDDPHVLSVIELARMDEDEPVLILEYLPGGSIHSLLATEGRPDLATAIRWLRGALLGLKAMHDRGIVHRDISAKNLMFRARDEVVVGDFGTVRHLDDATLTGSIDRIGSLIYMAPEQLREPHEVGLEADVYSVGQVGFQVLTGAVPLGNTGSAQNHDERVPKGISAAIEEMRSYSAAARPSDAGKALTLLDAVT